MLKVFLLLTVSCMHFVHSFETLSPLELLDPIDYKIAWPFFKNFQINEPMLYLTLENRGAGKVLTDSKINPSFVLVYNPACYTFLGGELDRASLQTVAAYLKTLPKVSLACPADWKYRQFFENEGFVPVERIQLRRSNRLEKVNEWKNQRPVAYNVKKIDRHNFAQCKWQPILLSFYGDEERFFDQAMGICLSDEKGNIVSESYALISTGKAEFGVVTDENYRGKNLGTVVCAFLLDYCYAHDLEPFWSCDQTNPASASVAKKLGFEEERRYIFLKWPPP